jgi:hypothetical protein
MAYVITEPCVDVHDKACVDFGPVLGPIAIVIGRGARRRAMDGASGKGFATAGVVLGVIGLLAGVYVWIVASTCDCL